MNLADLLANGLLEREGVTERRSRFGHEVAYYHHGREFLHLHGRREADIRVGRAAIRRKQDELAGRRGVRLRAGSSSDWVIVALERREDVEFALELADFAIAGK